MVMSSYFLRCFETKEFTVKMSPVGGLVDKSGLFRAVRHHGGSGVHCHKERFALEPKPTR